MTLTQAAVFTKKGIVIFATVIFLATTAFLGYRYYYYNIYLPSLPKPEIKPDIKFGILPNPILPQSTISATNYSYSLDTSTGNLPADLPKIAKVYFSPNPTTTLLSLDRATQVADDLEFGLGPNIISPTQYRFLDAEGGQLIIDLNSGNFRFQRGSAGDPSSSLPLPSEEKIAEDFRRFLSSKGLDSELLSGGPIRVDISSDSKSALVSIRPHDLEDKFPVLTDEFDTGLIKSTVTSGNKDFEKYKGMDYIFWSIDQKVYATYPIKTVDKAFEELKSGLAVVFKVPENSKISLRKIYLGYFLSKEYTPYIQPIFVFEGENFAAILPAITSQFLE